MRRFDASGSLSSTCQIKYSVNTYIRTDLSHVHRYEYISKILNFFMGWLGRDQDGWGTVHARVSGNEWVYRPSTMRFFPEGSKVPRVLIHLVFLIFCKLASQLQASSIYIHDCHVWLFVCSAIEVRCLKKLFSPQMCDLILVTIDSHKESFTWLHIKKYGSTPYLRIGQVLKWLPIHKV